MSEKIAVKASFGLQKPVSFLSAYMETLEDDILGEIGVPNTKISIISMRQAAKSNSTDVVFGVLPDLNNVPINLVSLSVLKSSLVELFLQRLNLSLTTAIFGKPSSFEILEFPGGINVVPRPSASMFKVPPILFNFTLNNSVGQIEDSVDQLTDQLKFGLHLRPYENLFVQLKNVNGSTVDPPVIVEASVLSDGSHFLRRERLKQLAQTIKKSPRSRNLGLDHSVFGKVKEIRLSSILDGTLSPTPTPSPSPSPSPFQFPSPSLSPSPSPSPIYVRPPSGDHQDLSPCSYCGVFPHASVPASGHKPTSPPISVSPAPSEPTNSPRQNPGPRSAFSPSPVPTAYMVPSSPPSLSPHAATLPSGPTPGLAPGFPLSPTVSPGISPGQDKRIGSASVLPTYAASPLSPSPSSAPSGLIVDKTPLKFPYSFYKLAVQWMPLRNTDKAPLIVKRKIREAFSIHGLWPCVAKEHATVPLLRPRCEPFDINKLKPIIQDLRHYWPDLMDGQDEAFWERQWIKHGCMDQMSQLDYFTTALDRFRDLNMEINFAEKNIVPGHVIAKQLLKEINVRGRTVVPDINCYQRQLNELRFTVDTDGETFLNTTSNFNQQNHGCENLNYIFLVGDKDNSGG